MFCYFVDDLILTILIKNLYVKSGNKVHIFIIEMCYTQNCTSKAVYKIKLLLVSTEVSCTIRNSFTDPGIV